MIQRLEHTHIFYLDWPMLLAQADSQWRELLDTLRDRAAPKPAIAPPSGAPHCFALPPDSRGQLTIAVVSTLAAHRVQQDQSRIALAEDLNRRVDPVDIDEAARAVDSATAAGRLKKTHQTS